MLQDVLLTDEEKGIKEEVREFVKNEVPSDLLKKMDRDEITYPKEFVEALGKRNLLGLRFSREYGGRGLDWTGTNEIMSLLIQHEYYKELLNDPNPPRISEEDSEEAHLEDEKVYDDDEMWTKGW